MGGGRGGAKTASPVSLETTLRNHLVLVLSPSPPLIGAGYASGRPVRGGAGLHFRPPPTRVNVLTSRRSCCLDSRPLRLRCGTWSWGRPCAGTWAVSPQRPGVRPPLPALPRPGAAQCVRAAVMDLNLNRADYLQVNPRDRSTVAVRGETRCLRGFGLSEKGWSCPVTRSPGSGALCHPRPRGVQAPDFLPSISFPSHPVWANGTNVCPAHFPGESC